jgi:hypothetical protein
LQISWSKVAIDKNSRNSWLPGLRSLLTVQVNSYWKVKTETLLSTCKMRQMEKYACDRRNRTKL